MIEMGVLLFLMALVLGAVILWVYAIVDVLENDFTGFNKLIWILVLLFFSVPGMILYFWIGRKQRIITQKPDRKKLKGKRRTL